MKQEHNKIILHYINQKATKRTLQRTPLIYHDAYDNLNEFTTYKLSKFKFKMDVEY